MGATQALAKFAIDPALATPPAQAAKGAAECLLDAIGCALGGSVTRMGRLIREFAEEQGGRPASTVIGKDGLRLPPMLAALVNGQLINVLDFDDTYLDVGHTGSSVIPAALAIGEQVGASGAELRAAIVAGYEVANRLGLATRPTNDRYRLLYPVGWHSFGATAAAGRLLGFDCATMENAFGITLEHMQVATTLTTETVHGFKAGKVGQAGAIGVLAALLAAKGFDGKRKAVDAEGKFWLAMGSDRLDPVELTADLGERWTIGEMSFKPFPSCRMTHGALGAAALLRDEYDIQPETIERIRVRTFSRVLQLTDPEPATAEAIPFSLPSTMGMLFRGVEVGASWASPATALDPSTVALAHKVEIIGDESFDRIVDERGALPAEVTVELDSGIRHTQTLLDAPWGGGDRPTMTMLLRKYMGMATPVLGERSAALAEAIESFAGPNPVGPQELMQFFLDHTGKSKQHANKTMSRIGKVS